MTVLKKILEYFATFCLGFVIYYTLEMIYDGSSHYAMGVLGGVSLIAIGALNDCAFTMKTPIWLQVIIGAAIITLLELVTGLLLNQDYAIWDYRNMPLNFKGQICLPFSGIWCICSLICILLQDFLNYKLFENSEKPKYYFWFVTDETKA